MCCSGPTAFLLFVECFTILTSCQDNLVCFVCIMFSTNMSPKIEKEDMDCQSYNALVGGIQYLCPFLILIYNLLRWWFHDKSKSKSKGAFKWISFGVCQLHYFSPFAKLPSPPNTLHSSFVLALLGRDLGTIMVSTVHSVCEQISNN